MNTSKVWYVTGASQGLGLVLVKKLLENGYRVAATSRDAHTLSLAVGLIDKDRFLPLAVDGGSRRSTFRNRRVFCFNARLVRGHAENTPIAPKWRLR